MKFREPTPQEVKQCTNEYNYLLTHISTDNRWFVGINRVMFGYRVVAWEENSYGPAVDYCAGDNSVFLMELLVTIVTILEYWSSDVNTEQVQKVMPTWKVRPINSDPCWEQLKKLSVRNSLLRNADLAKATNLLPWDFFQGSTGEES